MCMDHWNRPVILSAAVFIGSLSEETLDQFPYRPHASSSRNNLKGVRRIFVREAPPPKCAFEFHSFYKWHTNCVWLQKWGTRSQYPWSLYESSSMHSNVWWGFKTVLPLSTAAAENSSSLRKSAEWYISHTCQPSHHTARTARARDWRARSCSRSSSVFLAHRQSDIWSSSPQPIIRIVKVKMVNTEHTLKRESEWKRGTPNCTIFWHSFPFSLF